MAKSNFDDVGDFHTKFGLESVTADGAHPREMTRELMGFRLNFMLEELMELIQAVGGKLVFERSLNKPSRVFIELPENWTQDDIDHAAAFDALIDEAYVTFGLTHLLGYPWNVGWRLVQAANMAKERATSKTASERGGTWDVVKPEGWKPPDIEGALYVAGWETPRFSMPADTNNDKDDTK